MKSNNIIIGLLILIILILIAGFAYIALPDNQNTDSNVVNDTEVENSTEKVFNATLQNDYQNNDQPKHYDDWQEDYETGEYDEFGSPIYRSVLSTSGGQYEPGIYEAYWSENGPISVERIG